MTNNEQVQAQVFQKDNNVIFFSKHEPTVSQLLGLGQIGGNRFEKVAPTVENVSPSASFEEVEKMASDDFNKIYEMAERLGTRKLVLGGGLPEIWLFLLPLLTKEGFEVFTSTTERKVVEGPEDPKTGLKEKLSTFAHVQYRRLPALLRVL